MKNHILSIVLSILGIAVSAAFALASGADAMEQAQCIRLTKSQSISSGYTDNWKRIGKGKYTEDFFTTLLNVGNPT